MSAVKWAMNAEAQAKDVQALSKRIEELENAQENLCPACRNGSLIASTIDEETEVSGTMRETYLVCERCKYSVLVSRQYLSTPL